MASAGFSATMRRHLDGQRVLPYRQDRNGRARPAPRVPVGIARTRCWEVVAAYPALFSGWPSTRVYQPHYDAARMLRVCQQFPLIAKMPVADAFLHISDAVAHRRQQRMGDYAGRVMEAME